LKKNIKEYIDDSVFNFIKKVTQFVNPILLKLNNENGNLLVYYFHGIYENEAQKKLNHVDPQNNLTKTQLIAFIDYFLSNNYQFIKPEQISEGLPKDKKYILLTFDDGYFNNTLAIDILNKYKIPATFFLTTKNIVKQESFWWDVIFKYRIKNHVPLKKIREEQSFLKGFKYSFIDNYISENFGSSATKPWSDIDRPLTVEELRTISQNSLVTIGNHTHNHTILTVYDREEIKDQFHRSNEILCDITGYKPKFIAFPNGNFNFEILEECKEEGFNITFSTIEKSNRLPIKFNSAVMNLNRLMTQTNDINVYGNYDRLGYTAQSLYLKLKHSIKIFK
jgi:peptidoglycan/xylan/chitin deacetylase (PgdA/CDA1 family)